MHPNAELVTRFYDCFARRDAAGMGACYAKDVVFSDTVFPRLVGDEARAMWAMLCKNGKDLRLVARDIEADDRTGRAHWTATYTFSRTGRHVVNEIDATFAFDDGLITRHTDAFDFWRWSRQSLGPMGAALGWSKFLRTKVQGTADAGLRAFIASSQTGG